MSNQMTPIPASQQITQLEKALLKAFVDKAEAEATVKQAELTITAIRNVMAGVPMGQQLAAELAPPAIPEPPPPAIPPTR
jgi:hypothetical protein